MKVILTYSGGLDSTVLLYFLRMQGDDVKCLGVDYRQRHVCELRAAELICGDLSVEFCTADLQSLQTFLHGSSQTSWGIEVPEGHYTADNMKITVVPNRNMLILSVAIAWAISSGSDAVAFAAHGGDHAIYQDCRPAFVDAMRMAARRCDWHAVDLLSPFVDKTKADIVRIGSELNVPFEQTWSCYKGGELQCGKCGTCVERREAFQLAGVVDPTNYAS